MKSNKRNESRQGKPESLIIKFKNEKTRNKIFAYKKNLKGTTSVISEFLTQRKNLLQREEYMDSPWTNTDQDGWR